MPRAVKGVRVARERQHQGGSPLARFGLTLPGIPTDIPRIAILESIRTPRLDCSEAARWQRRSRGDGWGRRILALRRRDRRYRAQMRPWANVIVARKNGTGGDRKESDSGVE
jgi:hypothetical protein